MASPGSTTTYFKRSRRAGPREYLPLHASSTWTAHSTPARALWFQAQRSWIPSAYRRWLYSYGRQMVSSNRDRACAPTQFFDADRVGTRFAWQVQLVVIVDQAYWDDQLTRFDALDLL